MDDESHEVAAASELRATRLILAGILCVVLSMALVFLPRLVGVASMEGAWFAALAASVLGFWARATASVRSPSRATGLVLGLVALFLVILLGLFTRGGP